DSFERPTWPWQSRYTRTTPFAMIPHSHLQHRFSRRTSSSLSAAASPSNLQAAWDPTRPSSSQTAALGTTTARHHTGSTMGFSGVQEDSGTRQWSFWGFEWVLRDFVEGVQSDTTEDEEVSDDFELLKLALSSETIKFKLEIQAPVVPNGGSTDSKPATLTLCITSLMLDFCAQVRDEHEYDGASSNQMRRVGAPSRVVWEWWQNDWRESEVWDCSLPSLSALLENPRIRDSGLLHYVVQIHCPVGTDFHQQPMAYYVPRDLLEDTGDVRFVCLERMPPDAETPATPLSETSPSTSRRPSSSTSSNHLIYAHSDITDSPFRITLRHASSTFSETKVIPGDRKLYTIVVEEADFETIYWLLKYCYANWLSFKEEDDPRLAVEGIGGGWSARWLTQQRGGEWDWKTFTKIPGDDSTVASARSATSAENNIQTPMLPTSTKANLLSRDPSFDFLSSPTRSSPQAPRAPSKSQPSLPNSTMGLSSGISRTKPVPLAGSAGYTSRSHQSTVISTPDPHPHPNSTSTTYVGIGHLSALAALALDHMMSTITPATSFFDSPNVPYLPLQLLLAPLSDYVVTLLPER
ncbi:hypothetical protein B0H14DRAFT_2860705, partial [Mycena olivaceomarginata]